MILSLASGGLRDKNLAGVPEDELESHIKVCVWGDKTGAVSEWLIWVWDDRCTRVACGTRAWPRCRWRNSSRE